MALSVSVIVPLHRRTPAFEQCIEATLRLLREGDELIVVSDTSPGPVPDCIRLLLTGSAQDTSPAEKRDLALADARGDLCAFLDDDAYPADDWIERAVERFTDPSIVAVGGPGVTPPGSGWRERAGGAFYESPFGSGGLRFRFAPLGPARDVDDFPAYNLFVRTEELRAIGGWASSFYGGEDTKVCLALRQAGHRIVYDPQVLVYHHRRQVFGPHLRQVANVGRHRGHFVRILPETSRRPLYFAPALGLIAALAAGVWATRGPGRAGALAALGTVGAATVTGWALRDGRDPAVALVLPVVVAGTHAAYGAAFLQGLVTREIERM